MKRTVTITDHALVRWLHRVRGIDMEALRRALADEAQPFADACVKHAQVGDVWFVFHDEKLVTVVPDKPDIRQNRRHQGEPVNPLPPRPPPLSWQAKKRRRDHR